MEELSNISQCHKLSGTKREINTFINDSQKELFILINYVILCEIISLFGIVANVINMIAFYRQGLNTTINISFFAVAISDLCSLILQQLANIYVNPLFVALDLPLMYTEIQYLTTFLKREMFARITFFITVYITAERCFCIAFPLQIKQLITPRRATTVVLLIYGVTAAGTIPVFGTSYIDWKFYPEKNRTLLGLVYRKYKDIAEVAIYFLHAIAGLVAFLAIVVLTLILIHKLGQKNNWRKSANVSNDTMSQRDRATVKMVVLIDSVLIICYLPSVILCLATFFEPEFILGGAYYNLYYSMWTIPKLMENINSSVNIVLYYKMSSKYRHTLRRLFPGCHSVENVKHD